MSNFFVRPQAISVNHQSLYWSSKIVTRVIKENVYEKVYWNHWRIEDERDCRKCKQNPRLLYTSAPENENREVNCEPWSECKINPKIFPVWRLSPAFKVRIANSVVNLLSDRVAERRNFVAFGDAGFGNKAPDCSSFLKAYHFLIEFFVINLCHFFSVLFSHFCYNFNLPQHSSRVPAPMPYWAVC